MRLLAVFSHPDDELGCIGTLIKHARRGDEVTLLWTTHGELASQFVDRDEAEVRRVRREHGAWVAERVGGQARFFDMGDSRMTGSRDEAVQIARVYAELKPDLVISWGDGHGHPDHRMTAKIAYDALTLARIPKILNEQRDPGSPPLEPHRQRVRFLQYRSPDSLRPVVHVDIGEQIEAAKEIFCFYQEFYRWSYTPEQFLEGRAIAGRESGVEYAERFQHRSAYAPAVDYLW